MTERDVRSVMRHGKDWKSYCSRIAVVRRSSLTIITFFIDIADMGDLYCVFLFRLLFNASLYNAEWASEGTKQTLNGVFFAPCSNKGTWNVLSEFLKNIVVVLKTGHLSTGTKTKVMKARIEWNEVDKVLPITWRVGQTGKMWPQRKRVLRKRALSACIFVTLDRNDISIKIDISDAGSWNWNGDVTS